MLKTTLDAALGRGYYGDNADDAPSFLANDVPQVRNAVSGPLYEDRFRDNRPGVICQANDSRFVQAYFQEPLTTYAVGWGNANPELEAMLEFVAPSVVVPHRFEYAKGTNLDYFMSESDDQRDFGADFAQVKYTSTKKTDRTINKGLVIRVDMDEVANLPDWEQRYTGMLMKRQYLNDFRRAISLLKAAAVNNVLVWDSTAGKDPDVDVANILMQGNTIIGTPALNRAVYGATAWLKRWKAHRAQNTAGGFASALLDPNALSNLLMLDAIKVSREVYASGGYRMADLLQPSIAQGGTNPNASKSLVVDTTMGNIGTVLLYCAYAGQTTEDPSSIKRFISNTISGTAFRVYRQEINAKLVDITVEH